MTIISTASFKLKTEDKLPHINKKRPKPRNHLGLFEISFGFLMFAWPEIIKNTNQAKKM